MSTAVTITGSTAIAVNADSILQWISTNPPSHGLTVRLGNVRHTVEGRKLQYALQARGYRVTAC